MLLFLLIVRTLEADGHLGKISMFVSYHYFYVCSYSCKALQMNVSYKLRFCPTEAKILLTYTRDICPKYIDQCYNCDWLYKNSPCSCTNFDPFLKSLNSITVPCKVVEICILHIHTYS